MKKILAFCLAVSLTVGGMCLPAGQLSNVFNDFKVSAAESGTYKYGNFGYSINGSTVTITQYTGSGVSVTIPEKINGKQVTVIGSAAFRSCNSLESVVIPDSVTTIDSFAFSSCSKLKTVTLSKNLTLIDGGAFLYCSNLKSIEIPNKVKTIEALAFGFCTSLKEVNIPSSVSAVYGIAFANCSNIEKFTVSAGNPNYASSDGVIYTKDLKKVVAYPCKRNYLKILSSVTAIGKTSFMGNTNLKEITIPDGVKLIDKYAFYNCSSLKTVTIPSTVKTINENSLGYYADSLYSESKVSGFTIVANEDSAAAKYASDNNFKFTALPSDVKLSDCTITLAKNSFVYTGSPIKPSVTITYNGRTLVNGTDFVVRYSNNVNVGTGSVTITGKGIYKGTVEKTFSITERTNKAISSCTINLNKSVFTKTGVAVKPKVTVKDGTKVLTVNTDYVVRYKNNINSGTGSVVVSGRGKYTGSATKTFKIVEPEIKDISKCTITLNKETFSYTGKEIKPQVTVKYGNTVLKIKTDYNVRYTNNVTAGTGTVVISGIGNYEGTVNKTFKIIR